MSQFEYEITTYSAEDFKEVVYFCSPDGRCDVERLPADQIRKLQNILTERGMKGWELIQASFGRDGILAFWKRAAAKPTAGTGTATGPTIDI